MKHRDVVEHLLVLEIAGTGGLLKRGSTKLYLIAARRQQTNKAHRDR